MGQLPYVLLRRRNARSRCERVRPNRASGRRHYRRVSPRSCELCPQWGPLRVLQLVPGFRNFLGKDGLQFLLLRRKLLLVLSGCVLPRRRDSVLLRSVRSFYVLLLDRPESVFHHLPLRYSCLVPRFVTGMVLHSSHPGQAGLQMPGGMGLDSEQRSTNLRTSNARNSSDVYGH